MGNAYVELTAKRRQGINNFPMMFAFSDKQFEEGMKKLGLEPTDTDKVCRGWAGAIYRKSDAEALNKMLLGFNKEHQEAIANDKTGEGFIYDMFKYELANHEYTYTMEVDQTLDALGLTIEEVEQDERLLNGLKKACADLRAEDC